MLGLVFCGGSLSMTCFVELQDFGGTTQNASKKEIPKYSNKSKLQNEI